MDLEEAKIACLYVLDELITQKKITQREKRITERRFFSSDFLSCQKIAIEFSLARDRIRQLLVKVSGRIRYAEKREEYILSFLTYLELLPEGKKKEQMKAWIKK